MSPLQQPQRLPAADPATPPRADARGLQDDLVRRMRATFAAGASSTPQRAEETPQSQAARAEAEEDRAFLATVPAGPGAWRLAIAVVVVSALTFLAALPFVRVPLEKVPAFIPAYQSALAINDLITAILLFGQFNRLRAWALLPLASGYLFCALIVICHTLTFPGVFAPTGLLGAGDQSTAWLYVFWHGGFPLGVIAYAVLHNRDGLGQPRPEQARRAIVAAVSLVVAAVAAFALLATAAMHLLPIIIQGSDYSLLVSKGVSPAIWGLSLLALIALWRQKQATVLDLWLMVVMCVWLCDIALSAVFGSARYDLGWYAGRSYGLLAASFVLAILLLETNGLHGRLAAAKALLADRARDLERRVRDRTVELQRANEALKSEIVERQRAEEQLSHSQKMEALGQLTGGMAHDFNNILAIIVGNLDILHDLPARTLQEKELVQDALEAALRGSELIRRLLAFARRQPLRPDRIDVNALVGGISRLLARTLGENVEIELDLDLAIPTILADPVQLETAIANLANNARDAMPKGGRLTITTRSTRLDEEYCAQHADVAPGDYVAVEVSDTGAGMTPDVMARIFEPFYTTKGPGKGTGLGLSMVFGFLKQSGGHVNVYSEPGRGSTFRLYLRPAEPGAVETLGRLPPLTEAGGGGESILVVEDNAKLRQVVVKLLTDQGCPTTPHPLSPSRSTPTSAICSSSSTRRPSSAGSSATRSPAPSSTSPSKAKA
jgi:signal transduction histidine kinase